MTSVRSWTGQVWEDASYSIEGRIVDDRGVLLTAGTVSGWTVKVYDLRDTSTPVYELTQVGGGGFTALQPWDRDRTGKNFTHRIASGSYPMVGSRTYIHEYEWVSTETGTVAGVFRIQSKRRISV